MQSVIISQELLEKLIIKSAKELFSTEAQTTLDFENLNFIDDNADNIYDEVRIEIPIKEGEIPDVVALIDNLDAKDRELSEANANTDKALSEINLMREFLAFKGIQFDRDFKNKGRVDNETNPPFLREGH
jgi:hypothetical protein